MFRAPNPARARDGKAFNRRGAFPIRERMTKYECSKCGKELTYLPDHKRWYCYTCEGYAGDKGIYARDSSVKDSDAPKEAPKKENPCPDCGGELQYMPTYQAWYCKSCGNYKGLQGPANTASCPKCRNVGMVYSYVYQKWYCPVCQDYQETGEEKKSAAHVASAPKKDAKGVTVIDDLFLIYNDGRLIRHFTRRLKPLVDTDILSSMLVAVQEFVRDAFPSDDKEGNVEEIKLGELRIVVYKGKWISLAAIISGDDPEGTSLQLSKCIAQVESEQAAKLEKWNGDLVISKDLQKYITMLLAGEYAK